MAFFVIIFAVALLVLLSRVVYHFLCRRPGLKDDWPCVPDCRVQERVGKWPTLPRGRLKYITATEFRTLCALCDTVLPAFEAEDVPKAIRAYLMELVGSDDLFERLSTDMSYYTRGALDADV